MPNLLALCCLTSPKELITIAVAGFFILGLPLWTWYRKNVMEQDRNQPPEPKA